MPFTPKNFKKRLRRKKSTYKKKNKAIIKKKNKSRRKHHLNLRKKSLKYQNAKNDNKRKKLLKVWGWRRKSLAPSTKKKIWTIKKIKTKPIKTNINIKIPINTPIISKDTTDIPIKKLNTTIPSIEKSPININPTTDQGLSAAKAMAKLHIIINK